MKTYYCYMARTKPFPWAFFFQFHKRIQVRKSFSALF